MSTAQHLTWSRQQRRRVFWPVAALVFIAILAVVALHLGLSDLGSGAIAAATALAMVPVIVVVGAFLWLDRWEPEPGKTLILTFMWGAGVAVLGAMLINTAVGTTYGLTASAVVSAPLAEEGLKGAFVVGMLWWHRHQLDGLVDGVVYAGMVAAGFAFVENIVYLGRAFEVSPSDGYTVFALRGLISPFAHPLFTVFIGIAVGLAAHRGVAARLLLPIGGYLVAAALHALWNASTIWDEGRGFWATYVLVMVPLFAGLVTLALWQRHREQRVVATHVPTFADAGWVSWSEVPLLSDMRGRRHWRTQARAQSGTAALRAVRAYQTAATELAFVAERLAKNGATAELVDRHAEVVGSVIAARERAVMAALA